MFPNNLLLSTKLIYLLFSFILGLRSQTVETSTIDPDIIKKIQSLRDRLRDAEFQNSARSQELISLKAQLSELETAKAKNTRTSNKSHSNGSENSPSRIFFEGQNILRLPSIYNFMPHLMDSPGSLKPALHVSRDRQGGKINILQWNPVDTDTYGPKKTDCNNGVAVLKGFFT